MLSIPLIVTASMASLVLATPARLAVEVGGSGKIMVKRQADAGSAVVLATLTPSESNGLAGQTFYASDDDSCWHQTSISSELLTSSDGELLLGDFRPCKIVLDDSHESLQTGTAGTWFSRVKDGEKIGELQCDDVTTPGICVIMKSTDKGTEQACACADGCGDTADGPMARIRCAWS